MRPSLRPVAGAFVAFGLFWGTWAVAAADIEVALELSHGGLGLLLSVALGDRAPHGVGQRSAAERRGAGPVLALALAGWGVLLIAGALVRHPVALAAVVVAAVAAGGLVDVVMNVSAVAALAARPGSLVRFHALFNAGAAIGAASAAVLLAQRLSWRWAWAAVGVGALILAPVCGRARLPASEPGEHAPLAGALRLIRREGLVLLSLAFAVGAIVEAGIELWGVLFMRSHLGSGLLVGGVSAVAAYLVGATTRVVVGPVAGRRGAARGVTVGAGTAALGTSLLALAPVDWLAGAGLVIAAGGISLCWPLILAHAGAGSERPGPVVGAVTAVGYLGFVAGPAVVGWLSAAAGLRAGLLLLAAAAAFVAAAPAVARRHGRERVARP